MAADAAGAEIPLGERLKVAAVGGAGGALLTSLMRTTRMQVVQGREHWDEWGGARRAALYVLWHGRLLAGSFFHSHQGLATLISQHRDGDYIARVVQGWGFETVRGSSSRGGSSALRQLVRVLKRGTSLAVTPDGPRGPRQKMKLGPLLAAQLAGAPLIPVGLGTDRAWWFGGWDRFMVPKPFSRIRVAYGEPVWIPREADEAELERQALLLEGRLNALTDLVDGRA